MLSFFFDIVYYLLGFRVKFSSCFLDIRCGSLGTALTSALTCLRSYITALEASFASSHDLRIPIRIPVVTCETVRFTPLIESGCTPPTGKAA